MSHIERAGPGFTLSSSQINLLIKEGQRSLDSELTLHPHLKSIEDKIDYAQRALELGEKETEIILKSDSVDQVFALSSILLRSIYPETIPDLVRRREDPDLGGSNIIEHIIAGNGLAILGLYTEVLSSE